jgi:hypothetical protein
MSRRGLRSGAGFTSAVRINAGGAPELRSTSEEHHAREEAVLARGCAAEPDTTKPQEIERFHAGRPGESGLLSLMLAAAPP